MLGAWTILQALPPIPIYMILKIDLKDFKNEVTYFKEIDKMIGNILVMAQITTMAFVIMLWLIIGRFKRVEVQVNEDVSETTFNIFKKIQFL